MLGTWGLHNNLILRSMIDNIFAYFYHKCKTQNKITPYSSFALLETSVLWNCMIKWENTSNPNFSLCPAGDKCVDCQCKSPLPPGCDCDPGDFLLWFFVFMICWYDIDMIMSYPPGCDCDPGDSNDNLNQICWCVVMKMSYSSLLWLWSRWLLLLVNIVDDLNWIFALLMICWYDADVMMSYSPWLWLWSRFDLIWIFALMICSYDIAIWCWYDNAIFLLTVTVT